MSKNRTINKHKRAKIGARLKQERERVKLPQAEVAKVLGIPRTAVSQFEAGQRRIDMLEFVRLAELYKRSLDFLVYGAGLDFGLRDESTIDIEELIKGRHINGLPLADHLRQ